MNPFSSLTTDNFLRAALNLLPRGRAWQKGLGTTLAAYWGAIADLIAALHAFASNLVDVELFPATTNALIDLWERAWGLPDPCAPPNQTIAQREQALVARITDPGGLSRARLLQIAAAYGYLLATITEFFPFRIGSHIGDALADVNWRFVWRLNTNAATTITVFHIGSHCGDPLRMWGDPLLECAIREHNRATRIVFFSYLGGP